MKRYLFFLLLLLPLWPGPAMAVERALEEHRSYTFSSNEGDFGGGLIRGTGSLELLVDLSSRISVRNPDGHSRFARRTRSGPVVGTHLLLAMLSARMVHARELELPCGESPFVIYLPYHANPPPVLS